MIGTVVSHINIIVSGARRLWCSSAEIDIDVDGLDLRSLRNILPIVKQTLFTRLSLDRSRLARCRHAYAHCHSFITAHKMFLGPMHAFVDLLGSWLFFTLDLPIHVLHQLAHLSLLDASS